MIKRALLSFILFLFQQSIAFAQSDAESPGLLPKGKFLFFNYMGFSPGDFGSGITISPSLRYGLSDRFEIRINQPLLYTHSNIEGINSDAFGLGSLGLGTKIRLIDEDGWIPAIGAYTQINLPTGTGEFHSDKVSYLYRFSFRNTLSERVSLTYNIGGIWDGSSWAPNYLYNLVLDVALTPRVAAYAELYGLLPQGEKNQHNINVGGYYTFTNQFSLAAGTTFDLITGKPGVYSVMLIFNF
ncbi:transporter [Xanthovirga aplysinae]|uniref:transporter n=1 Tax=Xanthovirga aplysinae TaxID=2529853 RepID=UPI0012BCECB5|nr:transporter [Xanthovirga aplysinae]MTI29935.1 transporter [Xanthovirga aplysinae]